MFSSSILIFWQSRVILLMKNYSKITSSPRCRRNMIQRPIFMKKIIFNSYPDHLTNKAVIHGVIIKQFIAHLLQNFFFLWRYRIRILTYFNVERAFLVCRIPCCKTTSHIEHKQITLNVRKVCEESTHDNLTKHISKTSQELHFERHPMRY